MKPNWILTGITLVIALLIMVGGASAQTNDPIILPGETDPDPAQPGEPILLPDESQGLEEALSLPKATAAASGNFQVNQDIYQESVAAPAVAMAADGRFLVAWEHQSDIYVRLFQPNGTPLSSSFVLNSAPPWPIESHVDVAVDDSGNYYVVYTRADHNGIFLQRISRAGALLGSELRLDQFGRYIGRAKISMAPGRAGAFVVTWFSENNSNQQIAYYRVFDRYQKPVTEQTPVAGNQTAQTRMTDVAMSADGRFLVIWQRAGDRALYARHFSAVGKPLTGDLKVTTNAGVFDYNHSVAATGDGRYLVLWSDDTLTFKGDIWGRVYNAGTSAWLAAAKMNQWTTGRQYQPQVAQTGGKFLVTWVNTRNPLYGWAISGRWFRLNGKPLSNEFAISQTPGHVEAGEAAGNAREEWVRVWAGDNPAVGEEGGSSIYAQIGPLPPTVYLPTNDAYVMEAKPATTFGGLKVLNVQDAARDTYTFIKYNIDKNSPPVGRATLRLWVTNGSSDGGAVYAVSPFYRGTTKLWLETALTWRNAPLIGGSPVAQTGRVAAGRWVELDVTAAVRTGMADNGRVSLGIKNLSSDLAAYSSKEGTRAPQLVLDHAALP